MSGSLPVSLLLQKGSSTPELVTRTVRVTAEGPQVPESVGKVLLASGFPAGSPESPVPLSPTLLLNRDLGTWDEDFLQRLARAELDRYSRQAYRSYTVEPDLQLCVIGKDAEQLRSFTEQYGGVLDLEPLLLGDDDGRTPAVVEMAIERRTDGLAVRYAQRQPIDMTRCNSCRLCSTACPEHCITSRPGIDFRRCSLCRQCEEVCPERAIDVHGVEERSLTVPAILLLAGVAKEGPLALPGVYEEQELADYFATLYACQVDEVISCDRSICQYTARQQIGCRRCLEVCRADAVTVSDDGIAIDSLNCTECGGCVGVCPTGAMQYERFPDDVVVDYFSSLALTPGTTIVAGPENTLRELWWQSGDKRYPDTLFLECHTTRSLSLFHLLYLALQAGAEVVLLGEEETTNSNDEWVILAASLLKTYFGQPELVRSMTVKSCIDRQGQAAHLPSLAPLTTSLAEMNRRQRLASLLAHLGSVTGRQARVKANRLLPFATITCLDERCTHCHACLNGCRIGSLATDDSLLELASQPSLCIGCGICVQICPEQALTMTAGATLDGDYFTRKLLAKADPMACRRCGKVFGSRQSFERVMAVLASRETVNTSHYEYCEECRVINLFEAA